MNAVLSCIMMEKSLCVKIVGQKSLSKLGRTTKERDTRPIKEKEMRIDICPDCGFKMKKGEKGLVCSNCGAVKKVKPPEYVNNRKET